MIKITPAFNNISFPGSGIYGITITAGKMNIPMALLNINTLWIYSDVPLFCIKITPANFNTKAFNEYININENNMMAYAKNSEVTLMW